MFIESKMQPSNIRLDSFQFSKRTIFDVLLRMSLRWQFENVTFDSIGKTEI